MWKCTHIGVKNGQYWIEYYPNQLFCLFPVAMENYGCTSPFGPKKGNICMDQLKGEKVAKFHTNQIPGTISKQTQDGQCLNPCSYFSILQLRGSGIAGTATGTGSGTDAGTATGTASGTATGTSTGTASGTVTTGTPRMIEVTIT